MSVLVEQWIGCPGWRRAARPDYSTAYTGFDRPTERNAVAHATEGLFGHGLHFRLVRRNFDGSLVELWDSRKMAVWPHCGDPEFVGWRNK